MGGNEDPKKFSRKIKKSSTKFGGVRLDRKSGTEKSGILRIGVRIQGTFIAAFSVQLEAGHRGGLPGIGTLKMAATTTRVFPRG